MTNVTSGMRFEVSHKGTTPEDAGLVGADDIAAYMLIDSVAISTATSKAVSTVNAAAPDSSSISQAKSQAVSAAVIGTTADSKAVSVSGNTSVADSKALSVSGSTSIADSKAVSVATATPVLTAVANSQNVSTADSKAVSVATNVALGPTYPLAVGEVGATNLRYPVGHVRRYGAVGDGATDDSGAFQAAITAATTGGTAAAATRQMTAEIVFDTGDFVLANMVSITSTQFFRVRGAGAGTRLMCSGALACMLDLNGVAYCSIESLQFTGKTASDTCTDVIRLRWDIVTAARSTTVVNFTRVYILGLKFVNGFNIGYGSAGSQVSEITYNQCHVAGAWVTPEATWYQNGILIGTGTFGNNLMHSLYQPTIQTCRYGINVDATQAAIFGAQVQGSEVDLKVGTISYFTVHGLRSETSQRLLETGGPATTCSAMSLSDIDWHGDAINADGQFIRYKYGGVLKLTNVGLQAVTGGVTPKVAMGSSVPAMMIVDGIETPAAIHQSYSGNATYHTVIIKGHTVRAADNSTTSQVGEYRAGATTDIQWAPFTAAADVWWKRQSDASMLLGNNGDLALTPGNYIAGRIRMGAYYLWVDSVGKLRIKSSAPTSDLDGAVVGTQT